MFLVVCCFGCSLFVVCRVGRCLSYCVRCVVLLVMCRCFLFVCCLLFVVCCGLTFDVCCLLSFEVCCMLLFVDLFVGLCAVVCCV